MVLKHSIPPQEIMHPVKGPETLGNKESHLHRVVCAPQTLLEQSPFLGLGKAAQGSPARGSLWAAGC